MKSKTVTLPADIKKGFINAKARPGQPLTQHLSNVSSLAAQFARKCGLEEVLLCAGFFHDFGKISDEFQAMLDGINAGNDRVPHSIFGAKHIYEELLSVPHIAEIVGNIIAAHHGRLYDNITPDGDTDLLDKLTGVQLFPHVSTCPPIDTTALKNEVDTILKKLHTNDMAFALSMFIKLTFSCLVDADRLDAYRHENGKEEIIPLDCDKMLDSLTNHLAQKSSNSNISQFRQEISDGCAQAGLRERGIYKLEVPTGGGKTFASLRFALTHAKKHKLDRIIYVIPYLSILGQTANEMRNALGVDTATVLEHHSGFLSDENKEMPKYYNLQTDRWDAPIILTTQVQFLESVFSAKGSDLRKLHNIANSVIIFDEAQSIPVKCVHLFNGAINFLNCICGTTVLLCTATQPLLDKVLRPVRFSPNPSLVECATLSKRTHIVNAIIHTGYTYSQLADFVLDKHKDSTLVIVNTKSAAKQLYDELNDREISSIHLSTNMCAAHKDESIATLRQKLDNKEPVICISTQLIEAGVDISLECVIRDVAGLDSIFQAAGRCNRHGEFGEVKNVYVVNIAGENLTKLPDIAKGAEITKQLFAQNRGDDINAYYEEYFHARRSIMDFPTPDGGTVYDLLSVNKQGCNAYKNKANNGKAPAMRSALRSAADAFFVIDRGRKDIIVPYGDALTLVQQYCNTRDFDEKRKILLKLGKYSVSIYRYQEEVLNDVRALEKHDELTVLAKGFYDPVCGLDLNGKHEFLLMEGL